MIDIYDFSGTGSQMVEIPGGKIEMRDDRTHEQWIVELEPFLLGRFPVTQDLYFEITKESPSAFNGAKHPVETVSWKDAIFFCNLLSVRTGLKPCYTLLNESEDITFDESSNGFRLPTEAEWEYACKAGTTGIRYGDLDLIAWYKDNSERTTHPVGLKDSNAWGCMTCWVTFGSGLRTSMMKRFMALTVYLGVEAGVIWQEVVWQLIADAVILYLLKLMTWDSG